MKQETIRSILFVDRYPEFGGEPLFCKRLGFALDSGIPLSSLYAMLNGRLKITSRHQQAIKTTVKKRCADHPALAGKILRRLHKINWNISTHPILGQEGLAAKELLVKETGLAADKADKILGSSKLSRAMGDYIRSKRVLAKAGIVPNL